MATLPCPLCSKSIAIDAYYCKYCKRNLPTDANGKPSFEPPEDTLGTKYKVCEGCEKRVRINDDACWNCSSKRFKPLVTKPQSTAAPRIDPDSVESQLQALGDFHQWFTKKEIQHLPAVLSKGERIKALTSGLYQGNTWLITVTDQRLLFLDKGMVFGLKQVELPLKQISALSHKTGLLFGEIHISTSGGKSVIQTIPKGEVAKIAAIISSLIREAHEVKVPVASTVAPQPVDVASQLERLAALMEKGILTPEEFAAQKAKLLS